MGSTRHSLALGVSLALAACTAAAPGDDSPTRCGLSLPALAAAAGLVPARAALGLPAAAVRRDPEAAPGDDAIIIDPAPELRGEHRGLRITLPPGSCAPQLKLLPWVPTGPPPRPVIRVIGDPEALPHPLIGGVVVTGADPGAARDAAAWSLTFRALRLSALHLDAPTRAAALDVVGALCDRLEPGASALVVTTGRGTGARGGALVLGAEGVSWVALTELFAARCDHLGLLVWVVDAAAAGAIDPTPLGPLPLVLWRASDAAVPDAARLAPDDGGALSEVLAAVVRERLAGACLAHTRPRPAEVAALFAADGLHARLLAARWAHLGPTAAVAGDVRAALATALAAQLPATPRVVGGAPPLAARCVADEDCANLEAACDLPGCRGLRCEAGMCVAAISAGDVCDDENPCTEGDVCDAAGACRGGLVSCDDGDLCTFEGCEPELGCVFSPRADAAPCDDGDLCTEADACDPAGGCRGRPVDCDDADPCTLDRCVADLGCVSQPAALACDDGDACTFADACVQGVCAGTRRPCEDGNPCTRDGCDPALGVCVARPMLDGTPCDDGDPCTLADRCFDGACGGLERACDDGLACTYDVCEAGACAHLPAPGTCVAAGTCLAVGEKPADGACLMCLATGVIAADPEAEGAACEEDGVSCTIDRCEGGACRHLLPPGACATPDGGCVGLGDDVTPCLVCVDTGVAAPRPAGSPCSSGAECRAGGCDAYGQCQEVPLGCCPAEPIACGETVSGSALAGSSRVAAWSCAPGQGFPGPERTWWFEAPCAGLVTFSAAGAGGATVIVGDPDLGGCAAGACQAAGASIGREVAAGEALTVTFEGVAGAPWGLAVNCSCYPVPGGP